MTLGLAGLLLCDVPAANAKNFIQDKQDEYGALQKRANDIVEALSELYVPPAFCTKEENRTEIGDAINKAFADMLKLEGDYKQFRNALTAEASNSTTTGAAIILAYSAAGIPDPTMAKFWVAGDNAMKAVRNAVLLKQQAFYAASVAPCPGTTTTTTGGGTGGTGVIGGDGPKTPPPPPPPVGPVAGMSRPAVPTVTLPVAGGPFCSDRERLAWIDANITPLRFQISTARAELSKYLSAVEDRLPGYPGRGPKVTDPAMIQQLQGEVAWVDDTVARLMATYDKLVAIADSIKVDPSRCAQADPLQGLKRPLIELPSPVMPTRFCTLKELEAFQAAAHAYYLATVAAQKTLFDYYEAVAKRESDFLAGKLVVGGVPVDPQNKQAEKALYDEYQSAFDQYMRMRPVVEAAYALDQAARKATVADCGETRTITGGGPIKDGGGGTTTGGAIKDGGGGTTTGGGTPPTESSCVESDPVVKAARQALARAQADLAEAEKQARDIEGYVDAGAKFDPGYAAAAALWAASAAAQVDRATADLNAALKAAQERCAEKRVSEGGGVLKTGTYSVALQITGSNYTTHTGGGVTTSSTFSSTEDMSAFQGMVSADFRAQIPVPTTPVSALLGATVGVNFGTPPSAFQSFPKIDNTITATRNFEMSFYAGASMPVSSAPMVTVSLYGGFALQFMTISEMANQTRFGAGTVTASQDMSMVRPLLGFDVETPLGDIGVPVALRLGAEVVFPASASINFNSSIPAAATGQGVYSSTINFDTEYRGKAAVVIHF